MHLAARAKNSVLAVQKTNDKNKLLPNLFMHPCLKSGQLIHQMLLTMNREQLQNLVSDPEMDVGQMFFSKAIPLSTFIPIEQKDLP